MEDDTVILDLETSFNPPKRKNPRRQLFTADQDDDPSPLGDEPAAWMREIRYFSPLGPKSIFSTISSDGDCLGCDGGCGTGQVGGIVVISDQTLMPCAKNACKNIHTSTRMPINFLLGENLTPSDTSALLSQHGLAKLGLAPRNQSCENQITAIVFLFSRALELCPYSVIISELDHLRTNYQKYLLEDSKEEKHQIAKIGPAPTNADIERTGSYEGHNRNNQRSTQRTFPTPPRHKDP